MTCHFSKLKLIAIILGISSPLLFLSPAVLAAPADKIEVCHVPPDDPTNAHLIKISAKAVPAHQAHGDLIPATQTEGSVPGYCSDGIDNDCNGMTDSQDPSCGQRNFRYVFVTSGTYTGNLGGLSGADAICNQAAKAEGSVLENVSTNPFTAWLSYVANAKDRVSGVEEVEYRLVDGTTVVFPSTYTYPQDLSHPINMTEAGLFIPGPPGDGVWTNTDANGMAVTNNLSSTCDGFLSAAPITGLIGDTSRTTSEWTLFTGGFCNIPARLYCFENPGDL